VSTDIAAQPKPATLTDIVASNGFKTQLAMVLPKHLTPERFARIAVTCMRKVPKLQQCTQESLLGCLMTLSQYGLEPDGRRAHLIPFENRKAGTVECTLIIDYKGLAELVLRSGLVSYLHADVVCDGDVFEYNLGRIVSHVPWFLRRDKDKPSEPGEVYAVYATVVNKDGTSKSEVLSRKEVDAIRARSKSGSSGPWVTDWAEMAKKTAFKRLSKWLVLSAEFRDASESEDEADVIETTAVDRSAIRLADVIASAAVEHQPSTEPPTELSRLEFCAESMQEIGLEVIKREGFVFAKLPNGQIVKVTDGDPGAVDEATQAVNANDDDALIQISNIVERSRKSR
jgi:recombination protein RecT